jgi:hypothetical protein
MYGVCFRPLSVSMTPQPFESVTYGLAWKEQSASSVALEFVAHARTVARLLSGEAAAES